MTDEGDVSNGLVLKAQRAAGPEYERVELIGRQNPADFLIRASGAILSRANRPET